MYTGSGEIDYRDGVLGSAVDTALHVWESTASVSSASSRQLGCGDSTPANNWRGPILFVLQASIQLSASQRAGLVALLRSYYTIPDNAV